MWPLFSEEGPAKDNSFFVSGAVPVLSRGCCETFPDLRSRFHQSVSMLSRTPLLSVLRPILGLVPLIHPPVHLLRVHPERLSVKEAPLSSKGAWCCTEYDGTRVRFSLTLDLVFAIMSFPQLSEGGCLFKSDILYP